MAEIKWRFPKTLLSEDELEQYRAFFTSTGKLRKTQDVEIELGDFLHYVRTKLLTQEMFNCPVCGSWCSRSKDICDFCHDAIFLEKRIPFVSRGPDVAVVGKSMCTECHQREAVSRGLCPSCYSKKRRGSRHNSDDIVDLARREYVGMDRFKRADWSKK